MAKKNFVLDTNIILHDSHAIHEFQENDIFVPITVLEELDHFKKGNEQINFNAREFVRKIDELSDQDFFQKGASLGKGRGRLYVVVQGLQDERVTSVFKEDLPDHRILSAAFYIQDKYNQYDTILITKDVNLRMKARSLGMKVQDYHHDKVKLPERINHSPKEYQNVPQSLLEKIYASPDGISASEWKEAKSIKGNECFVFHSHTGSALVRLDAINNKIIQVDKPTLYGITPRNAEQAFAFNLITDPNIKLIGLSGKAGTGKTLLALAAALSIVDDYEQILLARPIVSLANKDLGFLPGDEKSKVAPYMQPLFDNLSVIKGRLHQGSAELLKIEELQRDGKFIIEALAYIRGRSLSNSIIIIDEAQNLTPAEVKTIITRSAEGTKMIFTGDFQQIDSPYLDSMSNGLAYMIDRMKGQKLFGHVNLVKGERSELSELASDLL